MVVKNVSTVLKDIKVTKKGINLTLEDVRLRGEELQDLASLIGEIVQLDVSIPQMTLFEDEDVNASDDSPVSEMPAELSLDSEYTAEYVEQELDLS